MPIRNKLIGLLFFVIFVDCLHFVTKLCNCVLQVSERHLEEVHIQELEKSYRDMKSNLNDEDNTPTSGESSYYESAEEEEFNCEINEKFSSRFTHEGCFSYV